MSLFDWFAARRKDQFVGKVIQETEEGDGLWGKCPECSQVVYRKDLIENASVCSNCGHHNRIDSQERINLIADQGSFEPLDIELSPTDPLGCLALGCLALAGLAWLASCSLHGFGRIGREGVVGAIRGWMIG